MQQLHPTDGLWRFRFLALFLQSWSFSRWPCVNTLGLTQSRRQVCIEDDKISANSRSKNLKFDEIAVEVHTIFAPEMLFQGAPLARSHIFVNFDCPARSLAGGGGKFCRFLPGEDIQSIHKKFFNLLTLLRSVISIHNGV